MATLLIIGGIVLFILGMGRKGNKLLPFDDSRIMRVGDKTYYV